MSSRFESVTKRSTNWKFRISISRVTVPYLAVFYIATLILAFRFFVTEYWAYSGLRWNPPTTASDWAIMLVPALIPAFFMPATYGRPSRLVLWILYIIVYVPACLVMPMIEGEVGDYWEFIVALLLSFLLLLLLTELPLVKVPPLPISLSLCLSGLFVLSALTFGLSFFYYGLPTSIPGLSEVYDVRSAQSSRAESAPLILAYLAGWQYKVVNLLVMALGLQLRNKWLVIGGLAGQLYFFSVTGHRSVLFSGLLVLFIWLLTKKFTSIIGPMALVGTIAMIVLTSIVLLAGNIMLFSIFVRRLLVVPGSLSARYFEFFSEFGFTRSIDPITRMLFESPYDLGPPHLIALYSTGGSRLYSANANFWASGYAGFGVGGMIAVTLILGAILWVMNSLTTGEHRLIGNILVALSAFSLTNSELSTTIGTHGLGIALVFLIVLPVGATYRPVERDQDRQAQVEAGKQLL